MIDILTRLTRRSAEPLSVSCCIPEPDSSGLLSLINRLLLPPLFIYHYVTCFLEVIITIKLFIIENGGMKNYLSIDPEFN